MTLFRDLVCIQFSSLSQSCTTLCDPMNRSTPGLPVHHQLPEFTQTHVQRVGDAIQSSHPLSSPSPLAPNPSQHQSLFWIIFSPIPESKMVSAQYPIGSQCSGRRPVKEQTLYGVAGCYLLLPHPIPRPTDARDPGSLSTILTGLSCLLLTLSFMTCCPQNTDPECFGNFYF